MPPPKSKDKQGAGFVALQGKKYASLVARMELVPVEPGCAVLWDWRTPHQTAAEHPGPDTREVVYTSFLPDIPINREYAEKQAAALLGGRYPPDFSVRKLPGAVHDLAAEARVPPRQPGPGHERMTMTSLSMRK